MSAFLGFLFGLGVYVFFRFFVFGFFTVQQNERAVLTSFGRAQRIQGRTTLDLPIAQRLAEPDRQRYRYPIVKVIGPGGPYFKLPWQKVHKVDVAIRTVNLAYDPDSPTANFNNTMLEAVTRDQLNICITGQMRYKVSEENIYAYLFGVKNPIAHIMGYFVSILRERIANFRATSTALPQAEGLDDELAEAVSIDVEGVSINDLRKNLNQLNTEMEDECLSSDARYGISFDASLITGIDPPQDIESALAAINTAHNEVSAELSVAQALADQKIEQSKRAVEIQTMRAEAQVEPLERLADELRSLKERGGSQALDAYIRSQRIELFGKAKRVFVEGA